MRLARRRLVLAQGWLFRDPGSLARRADDVRAFFRPQPEHAAAAEAAVAAARRVGRVVVGVHVRRGDYSVFEAGRYFYEPEQYADVMRRVDTLVDRETPFLICSDEPVELDAYARVTALPGPGHPVEDLYALAACDYLVGPPSTFTAWASFYGDVPLCALEDPDSELRLESFRVHAR